MNYELKDIKDIRKKAGLTQAELAKKAGVSQSLIAKVESGLMDPTYTNAKKIFAALESLTQKNESKAEEIMNKKVISVSPNNDIQDAIKKIRKYEISQLPVIDNGKLIGYITEVDILDALMKGDKNAKSKEIMKETPPTIDTKANMSMISNLLKFYPMVLVVEKGEILGIITKSDMIKKLSDTGRWGIWGY